METKLDRFGRVVLPKAVRDELGLEPGISLTVREDGARIVLEPQRDDDATMVVREGVYVWTGRGARSLDHAVRALRERHLSRLAGRKKA